MIDYEAAAAGIARAPEPEPVEPEDPEEAKKRKIFGPTLNEDGSLRCVSPTQYKNHKRCRRLWYYDKVLKRPRKKKSKGAQLGTECHTRMEKFLNTGVDIRGPLEKHGDEMIRPYLARAPFNDGDMLVEEPLLNPQLVTPGGIRITGFSDVTLPPVFVNESAEDGDHRDRRVLSEPIVIDHKFKKKLAQYADTEEQLRAGDPQAVLYTLWALTKWPEAGGAEFRHHNHQTEGARLNKPVSITDDRETVFAKWRSVGKYIDEEMAQTARIKDVSQVPAAGDTDPSQCRAYGGCDYLNECASAPHNRFVNGLHSGHLSEIPSFGKRNNEPPTQGYDLMGLLDEMMEPPKTPAAPAASAAPKALPPIEARECKAGWVYMIPGGPVGKFEGVLGDRAIFKDKDGGLLQCAPNDYVRDLSGDSVAAAIFEKKPRKLTVEDTSTPTVPQDTTPKIDPKAGIVPKDAPPDTNPPKTTAQSPAPVNIPAGNSTQGPEATTGAESPAATEGGKKRGRPPGSTNKPKTETSGLIVLVNNACPAAEDLMPYVQGLCDALAKKAGLADVRLAEKGSDLAYGAWKAILAVMAKTNPPPPGLYVIQRTDLTESVIEALSTVGIVSHGGRA